MLDDHEVAAMPPAPKLLKILGPSFILLGLGLGSGELILWPYLTSNFGLGIIWGAVLGITLQFFINMEIERYALVRGESIFVGFARKFKYLPAWFIFSTLIPWIWPGIIASSAVLLGAFLGIGNTKILTVIFLVLVGGILTLGPVLYKTQEKVQRTLIILGTPFIFSVAIFIAKPADWAALGAGIIGQGNGFWFLPAAFPLASFLAAVAYAGAGGNLNLAQSYYVKEKGLGMGKYAGRITSILTGKKEEISLTGAKFLLSGQNLANFKNWWRLVNLEHGLVFWFMGALTILLLSLLAFATVFGQGFSSDITFVLKEALVIGEKTAPAVGRAFLFIGGLMLFSTQLGVFDTTSRILTENLSLAAPKLFPAVRIRRNFYVFLWLQIILAIIIILSGFNQPLALLTLAAVLNAAAMFVHIPLTLWLNVTRLEREIRPSVVRIAIMVFAFVFFGYFTVRTLLAI
ncbi:MAG: Nramp family divalent metal transporter [Patescibacteria group bacterium]